MSTYTDVGVADLRLVKDPNTPNLKIYNKSQKYYSRHINIGQNKKISSLLLTSCYEINNSIPNNWYLDIIPYDKDFSS